LAHREQEPRSFNRCVKILDLAESELLYSMASKSLTVANYCPLLIPNSLCYAETLYLFAKSCNFSPFKSNTKVSQVAHLLSQLFALYQDWSRQPELEIKPSVVCVLAIAPALLPWPVPTNPLICLVTYQALKSAAALLQLVNFISIVTMVPYASPNYLKC